MLWWFWTAAVNSSHSSQTTTTTTTRTHPERRESIQNRQKVCSVFCLFVTQTHTEARFTQVTPTHINSLIATCPELLGQTKKKKKWKLRQKERRFFKVSIPCIEKECVAMEGVSSSNTPEEVMVIYSLLNLNFKVKQQSFKRKRETEPTKLEFEFTSENR